MHNVFEMSNALLDKGFYIGMRDPQRNTDFDGQFMIAESMNVDKPTCDASTGGYCIVGNHLATLIQEAYEHNIL